MTTTAASGQLPVVSAGGGLIPCADGTLPLVAYGEGVYLVDSVGNRYLDGSSGAAAANLGHGNAAMAEALAAQALAVGFAHRTHFRSQPAEDLAREIGDLAPGDLNRSIFTSSGSEANEIALRMAMEFWRLQGAAHRDGFLSRATSYHGSTLGALSLTGQVARRAGVEGLLHDFPRLHAGRRGPTLPSAQELSAELESLDPTRLAGVVTETVGGASSGAAVPPPGYHQVLRDWCDRHDVLWIADEVMCGFGRTGRWFAVEHDGVVPDLLVFGKGVSGGYAPLAGVVVRDRVARVLVERAGHVTFGHTYTNAPITCAAGVATIREMRRLGAVENAAVQGATLGVGLDRLVGEVDFVSAHRGRGLLRALEFGDPASGRPFPPASRVTARVLAAARAEGLLCYPAGKTLYGDSGDAVLIAPPLIIAADEVADLLARLRRALIVVGKEVLADRE